MWLHTPTHTHTTNSAHLPVNHCSDIIIIKCHKNDQLLIDGAKQILQIASEFRITLKDH